MSASGVHCDTPVAPWIWIALSMISHTRIGTIALTALTHTRASALPSSSIALAAVSTIRRIDSISMRAWAIICTLPPEVAEPLAERLAGEAALGHQLDRPLGRADRTHAVMDAARAEAHLGDLEPAALTEQHVLVRHAHVVEPDVHVPVRRVVLAEHVHRPEDLDTGRVGRHEDLRLALVRRRIRVGLHHRDHDLAARVARARDVVLLAGDHPLVTVTHRLAGHVLRVRRRHVGLGHRVRRPDLAD